VQPGTLLSLRIQLVSCLLPPFDTECIALVLERLEFNLQRHNLPIQFLQFVWFGLLCKPQRAGGLVNQVDSLIRKEAVGDVSRSVDCCCDECSVGDANSMVNLVLWLETTKDRDGGLKRGLVDLHGLESALEGSVAFNVFAVLVWRCGSDELQATSERRLNEIGGRNGAFSLAKSKEDMEFVDEADGVAALVFNVSQERFELFLELAADARACNDPGEVKRENAFVEQRLSRTSVQTEGRRGRG